MPKSILRLSGEVLSLFAIVSLLSIPSSSQTTFGSITGTITDSSGGVIIGASVTVTNEQTGAQRLGRVVDLAVEFASERVHRVLPHVGHGGDLDPRIPLESVQQITGPAANPNQPEA